MHGLKQGVLNILLHWHQDFSGEGGCWCSNQRQFHDSRAGEGGGVLRGSRCANISFCNLSRIHMNSMNLSFGMMILNKITTKTLYIEVFGKLH